VVGDDQLSEFALGRVAGGPVRIFTSCQMTLLQTIPDAGPGAGFGAAIAPMGDLNGDGYLDLAIGAPEHSGGVGRVYLMKSSGAPGSGITCKPPDPGGGGGSGGGAGGGSGVGPGGGSGGGNTPTGGGKKVGSLAKRSISFSADKKRVKVSKRLVLGGRIKARKRRAACERKQKVAIQRFARNNSWQTIDVAVSRKNGRFSVEAFPGPARTFIYRARVNQTRRCVGAASKRVKVKVLP
jgi:hypothetical protein